MKNPTSKLEIAVRALMLAYGLALTANDAQKADDFLEVARWHYDMAQAELNAMQADPAALALCIPLAEDCVRFIRTGR